jgi:hypothetical protein
LHWVIVKWLLAGDFSFLYNIQAGSGAYPASYTMVNGRRFTEVKAAGA